MKKTYLLLLLINFLPIVAFAGQDFGTVFDADIYKMPNTNSELITTIPVGTDVTIVALDRLNYWAKVELSNGQTGYVDLGNLSFPGGQEITITETFDSEKINKSQESKNNVWEAIIGILFLLAIVGALAHMLYVRSNIDNEKRIFVGSGWRIFLFALLLFSGVFVVDGVWVKIFQIIGTAVVVAFSYYAYLKPASKLVADGPPTKSFFQILGGMWTDIENREVDKARLSAMERERDHLQNEMNTKGDKMSDNERNMLSDRISSIGRNINEELNRTDEKTTTLYGTIDNPRGHYTTKHCRRIKFFWQLSEWATVFSEQSGVFIPKPVESLVNTARLVRPHTLCAVLFFEGGLPESRLREVSTALSIPRWLL